MNFGNFCLFTTWQRYLITFKFLDKKDRILHDMFVPDEKFNPFTKDPSYTLFFIFSVETLPFDCYEFLKMFYIVFRQSSGSVD